MSRANRISLGHHDDELMRCIAANNHKAPSCTAWLKLQSHPRNRSFQALANYLSERRSTHHRCYRPLLCSAKAIIVLFASRRDLYDIALVADCVSPLPLGDPQGTQTKPGRPAWMIIVWNLRFSRALYQRVGATAFCLALQHAGVGG
jgi:hypothetical protein